ATGFALAVLGASGISPASALFGLIVGFLLMLPGHTLGATGAGDVKLFAAAGTLLGAEKILPAFVWVALAGGLLAMGVAGQRGRLARTVQFTSKLVRRPTDAKPTIESPGEHNRF